MTMESPVPEAEAVPCVAGELTLQVMVSRSASVACKVRLNAVGLPFSDIDREIAVPSVMEGMLFWGLTVSVPLTKFRA